MLRKSKGLSYPTQKSYRILPVGLANVKQNTLAQSEPIELNPNIYSAIFFAIIPAITLTALSLG